MAIERTQVYYIMVKIAVVQFHSFFLATKCSIPFHTFGRDLLIRAVNRV